MSWLRRARTQGDSSGEIELAVQGSGVVALGSPAAVARFSDQVRDLVRDHGRLRSMVVDGLTLLAAERQGEQQHGEYFEFSPRALELLKQHGAVPGEDGFFHSFVRADGQIAGNLTWKQVDVAADQALSMQSAAVNLALQAAIRDVADAVARVEGKVDKLLNLVRAERLGQVVGDQRALRLVVEEARRTGLISDTDWQTVATLGPQILRTIEGLRDFLRREVDQADGDAGWSRSDELKDLTDEMIGESLALLVIAEDNFTLWQELRLIRIGRAEPHALASTSSAVSGLVQELRASDQSLLDSLCAAAGQLLEPTGYEGFRPLERRRLAERGEEIARSVIWFANQRHLDSDLRTFDYPSMRESAEQAARTVADAVSRRLPSRGSAEDED